MDEFRLDWERPGRTGTSEAVLCEPKSAAQIDAIVAHAAELGRRLLLTRLGARKWAPRFDYLLTQVAYVNLDEGKAGDAKLVDAFKRNVIHDVLAVCAELRPSVDISVS